MAWNLYDQFRLRQHESTGIDLEAVTVKVAIVTSAYTPDQNLHDFWSDVSANEVSGTGYTAGGNAAATPTVTLSGAGLVTFDAADPAAWAQDAGGFTNGRRFIVYADSGVASTSLLIAYSDAEASDFGNVDGPVTLTLNASGIWTQAR